MNELREIVSRINSEVYGYRYQEALQLIDQLIHEVARWQDNRGNAILMGLAEINEILEFVNQAIMDKDYLRMADLLEYELLKAVESLETPKEELQ